MASSNGGGSGRCGCTKGRQKIPNGNQTIKPEDRLTLFQEIREQV